MDVDSLEFLQDPYPFYHRKREQSPAYQQNDTTWTLTSYQLISKFLASPAAGRGNVGQMLLPGVDLRSFDRIKQKNPALRILDQWMLFKNPPEHNQQRRVIANVFTGKMVSSLEGMMRTTSRELLARAIDLQRQGQFDLVASLAYPLPLIVSCRMLGIPSEDIQQFGRWTQSLATAVQTNFVHTPRSYIDEWNKAASMLEAYFARLVPLKKQQNSDDLISKMVNAGEDSMNAEQVLANSVFLLFSGMETTTSMITNMMHALLSHPEQYEQLHAQPELINNAIDECLRYNPPVQMIGRRALGDIELEDLLIKQGDQVFSFLGAAGRDPEANPNPDIFDIHRKPINHLVFARGAHHCLGANLVRLELKVVVEELLTAFSELKLDGRGKQKSTWLMRGFSELPIIYTSK